MNIVHLMAGGDQPPERSTFGFYPRMEELAELLLKREVLRLLYKELKPQGEDQNICLHLKDIERAGCILDRQITIAHNCLMIGVLR